MIAGGAGRITCTFDNETCLRKSAFHLRQLATDRTPATRATVRLVSGAIALWRKRKMSPTCLEEECAHEQELKQGQTEWTDGSLAARACNFVD